MLIGRADRNLAESIKLIEGPDKFGFALKPTKKVWPKGINCPNTGVVIMHLDMYGPRRNYSRKTKSKGSYNGSFWESDIQIYPDVGFNSALAAGRVFEELLGKPYMRQGRRGETIFSPQTLRYDFHVDQQPKRDDGIGSLLHQVFFTINPPEDTAELKEREDHEYIGGPLGDLANRIYFPPPARLDWSDMPWIAEIAKKTMEKK